MVTEMFLNVFPKFSSIRFCEYKNHFVSHKSSQKAHGANSGAIDMNWLAANCTAFSCKGGRLENVDSMINFYPSDSPNIVKILNGEVDVAKMAFVKQCSIEIDEINAANVFPFTSQVVLDFNTNSVAPNNIGKKRNSRECFDKRIIDTCQEVSVKISEVDVSVLSKNELCQLQKKFGFVYYRECKDCVIELHNQYPICSTVVTVGKQYVKEFLIQNGHGVYIEQHSMPHVHRPLNDDSKGCMLYGTTIDRNMQFVFLKIPLGSCVYTKPYSWHADCYLSGQWEVLYSTEGLNNTLSIWSQNS